MYMIRLNNIKQLELAIDRQVKRGQKWIEQLEKTRRECPPDPRTNSKAFKSANSKKKGRPRL